MATPSTDAGTAGNSTSGKTPAQMMQEQHDAAQTHNPTVEDVPDEDDVQHPPPSQTASKSEEAAPAFQTNGVMSAKAAGKQKATDSAGSLDTHDEEAFPSLGAAPKSSGTPSARAPGWVASASAKSAAPNKAAFPARNAPSGTDAPTSTAANARGNVMLPGRYRDSFEIDNQDLDKNKSVRRVLDDVKKKYNVIVTPKSTNFATRTEFTAEGPKARVTEALMYISKELTLEKQVKLEIPSTVSAQIIGKAGTNIKKLESQFNVHIRIDRDKTATSSPEDIRTDMVEIRGHAAQVRQVYEQISNQVKQLQPKVDLPVRNIPPEFYPFLAGRHAADVQKVEQANDLRIQIPSFHTWQQQPPPRPVEQNKPPTFVPHGDSIILISGDQAGATQARSELDRLARQLHNELYSEELACEQILHPYIVGERGMDPLEFLEQTGCVVILPPSHVETEDIHIVGPQDRLEAGRNLAEQLMSQKHNRAVDLHKHFGDAPQGSERHSRALAQYLKQKAIEREFMDSHKAEIVFPSNLSAPASWTVITSDPQKALSARNELAKITQAYPTSRLALVEVDPFFHPHLDELHASRLRNDFGVHMIVPDDGEDSVVLVYEGPENTPFTIPRSKPNKAEITAFEKALQQAQAQILGSIPHKGISADDLSVPRKHHDRVRRFINNEPKPQASTTFPVQVNYGIQQTSKKATTNGSRGPTTDSIYLRGPDEAEIAALRQKIEQFLVELEQDEKERGYTTSFDFPAQYNKNLIGKQGAHIKSLREKHDVDIDTRENGKIKIQGPQKKAEAAKAEILRLAKQWEDEVNYTIKVEPKYHGMLVGRNGENLQKIQTKVNNDVRIDFPRVSRAADDQSVADNASDYGGKSAQGADEIRIRGPRAKADKVRDELLSLHQYLMDNSYTATVSVAQDQVASLIGKRGQEMEKLRTETGAQIDIPKGESGERVTVTLKGTKQQVEKAKVELQKRSKAFDDVVTRQVTVDRKHHRALIGGQGSNIQSIVVKAGGTGPSAEHVRFPRQGEESDNLTIKGTEDVVEKILASILAFVDEKENQTSDTIDVPVNQHRELIGANGNIRKKLEDDFGVQLNVPRQGSGQTGVKITGGASNVAKAKEHIIGLTSKPEGETIMVPRALHHTISKNGQLFRELSRDGIKIDHNGQKPPARPRDAGRGPRARNTNGDMPLITDQPGEESYSWNIVSNQEDSGEGGEIPWVIYPSKETSEETVAALKKKIEGLMQKAAEPQHTGYLILPDPRQHRHIIGQGGSTINSIRKASGCDIQVPNRNSGKGEEGEAITIVGKEQGVLEARDLILEEIKRAESGRNTPRTRA